MKNISFLLVTLAIVFQACQAPSNTATFWVSGIKTECSVGAGQTVCLQVHKGNDVENANWEHFSETIEGFEFEDGYMKHIEVLEVKIDKPSADAAAKSYTLVKVLETQQDKRMGLHDIWACKSIAEHPIDTAAQIPTMEINLRKMVVMGTNGCNSFNGKIENLTSAKIKLGPMAETRKMCLDAKVPDAFNVAINHVDSYKIENRILHFYDEKGNELLAFLKVD